MMNSRFSYFPLLLTNLILSFCITNLSHAQDLPGLDDKYVPPDFNERKVAFQGWDRFLGLGLYGTLTENDNVVGKDDGQSTTLGLKINGAIDYKKNQYEWLNSVDLLVAYSRTPIIPKYLKSEDTVLLESLYKYYLKSFSWLGVFTRFSFETALFEGYDTLQDTKTYRVIYLDNQEEFVTTDRFKLTDRFRPIKFRESVGGLAQILNQEILKWDIKIGAGLRQVMANDQFVIFDNDQTPEREVREVQSYRKAGYEIGTEISGRTEDKKITYEIKADMLFPIYESPMLQNDDRSLFDKRIIDLKSQVSFRVSEWASFDYVAKVIRDPDILAKTQVSQSFLFSISQTLAPRRTH